LHQISPRSKGSKCAFQFDDQHGGFHEKARHRLKDLPEENMHVHAHRVLSAILSKKPPRGAANQNLTR